MLLENEKEIRKRFLGHGIDFQPMARIDAILWAAIYKLDEYKELLNGKIN